MFDFYCARALDRSTTQMWKEYKRLQAMNLVDGRSTATRWDPFFASEPIVEAICIPAANAGSSLEPCYIFGLVKNPPRCGRYASVEGH